MYSEYDQLVECFKVRYTNSVAKGYGDSDGVDEQRAEAVLIEKVNDYDMATESFPKEIINDHRAYSVVC